VASDTRGAAVAVGLLPDGAWAGFTDADDGFRLAFGAADGTHIASPTLGRARSNELLAVATAYYEEELDAPPPELEATQADLAALVGWLMAQESDARCARLLEEALDAIDDGLAGDVVVARLNAAALGGAQETNEQADPIDLLVSRYLALSAPGD
jgi:hypothetical protein